jgi:hypothetical protein
MTWVQTLSELMKWREVQALLREAALIKVENVS